MRFKKSGVECIVNNIIIFNIEKDLNKLQDLRKHDYWEKLPEPDELIEFFDRVFGEFLIKK